MSLGFYFDMTRCSGCAACRTACQDRFDLFEVGFAPRVRHKRFLQPLRETGMCRKLSDGSYVQEQGRPCAA